MKTSHRILALAAAVLLLAVVQIGHDLFRWRLHAPERQRIVLLEAELEEAAFKLVASHVAADSLRQVLEATDLELQDARGQLGGVSRVRGRAVASASRMDLRRYNQRVGERNTLFNRWRETLLDNQAETELYNGLADSIRTIADGIGEPYWPIRSPAEIVARRHEQGESE